MSFGGSPGYYEQISRLEPSQQGIKGQLINAAGGKNTGGAFGQAYDYYSSLFNDDNDTFRSLANPEQRRFREEIIPGLSEQFAGMGSGGLSSSGFRNAAVSAGTDLSERLGAIRANLRQQGAAGLMGLGQAGLQQFSDNVYRPGEQGFLSSMMPGIGSAVGSAFGPIGSAFGNMAGNWLQGITSKGSTGPYGAGGNAANAAANMWR